MPAEESVQNLKNHKIGVLMGGMSAERDVSSVTGGAVLDALSSLGYQAHPIDVDRGVDQTLREAKVDVVFNALHGRYGEDGCIQGLLEVMGIPYSGSGVLASALAMDKIKAKEVFRFHNLPTPPYYVLAAADQQRVREVHGAFGFPVVVKPSSEGSSLGVSVAANADELVASCERAFALDDTLLIERHISGKEVSVGVLNGRALGALSVVSHNEIFDFEAKYTAGHAHYHVPARLSAERYRGVLTQALRAHQSLGCEGATRVDMMVSDLGNEYILEVNTLPGLTPRSLLPRLARHAGIDYAQLIEQILSSARLRGPGVLSPPNTDPVEASSARPNLVSC